jgi:hypothetical protein
LFLLLLLFVSISLQGPVNNSRSRIGKSHTQHHDMLMCVCVSPLSPYQRLVHANSRRHFLFPQRRFDADFDIFKRNFCFGFFVVFFFTKEREEKLTAIKQTMASLMVRRPRTNEGQQV